MEDESDMWVIELFNPPCLWGYWDSEYGAQMNNDALRIKAPDRLSVVRKVVQKHGEVLPLES